MEPTQSLERIRVIDSIRGVALLGILLVNMIFFGNSLQAISLGGSLWPGMMNEGLKLMQTVLIDGKFMAMFSFLFGLGMVIFRERALNRKERFVLLYMRRLLALLFLGLLHGIFIWYGDILFHYALLGFMLMLFHGRKPKTLLVWSILLLLGVGYIVLIVLAFQKEKTQKLLLLFSYPGRMAFTNYIFQSIIGTFIFYSYGLGLFGKVSPFFAFLIALGIYAFQMICSAWWLSCFRMGPLEWGWRACTYLRWPLLR